MSVIGDSRRPDGAGPGFLPLRHHIFDSQSIPLDMRACVLGIEIENRTERGPGAGFYQYTDRSVGDINGGMLWRLDMSSDDVRELPMWRFSFPSMIDSEASIGDLATAGNEQVRAIRSLDDLDAAPRRDPFQMFGLQPNQRPAGGQNPIADVHKWVMDFRLPAKSSTKTDSVGSAFSTSPVDSAMRRWWPKFPKGHVGVSMALNREDMQESVFMPTDPRLVAANTGDDRSGSLVYDLALDAYDERRHAPLQGIMRVLLGPFDGPCVQEDLPNLIGGNALALQIGWSGAGDIRGGFFFEDDTAGAVAPELGGLFVVGLPEGQDPHHLFDDADDQSINSMAISLDAFFSPPGGSKFFNAPKEWLGRDNTIPVGGDVWRKVKHVWTPHKNHKHPCTGEDIEGMHHWIAACVAEYGQPSDSAAQAAASEPAWNVGETPMTPPGSLAVASGPTLVQFPSAGNIVGAQIDLNMAMGEGGGASVDPSPQPLTDTDIFREFNQIYSETAMPGILARPQFHKTGVADLRNWGGSVNEGISPRPYYEAHKRLSPIVARLEAFGQQGASEWVYTHSPASGGRYAPSPSADGGWMFAPPESSLLQVEGNTQPSTVSNPYLVIAPNARLGFGRPSTTTGSMTSGISVEVDSTNNRLKGYTETTGTRVQVFEIDQDIETKVASKGFIVRTPDNSKSYRIRVDNSGNFASDLIS